MTVNQRRSAPAGNQGAPSESTAADSSNYTAHQPHAMQSRQVSWWSVHEFVTAAIQHADVTSWPMAGTPTWCALADGDPRKWAALMTAGEHWSLRVETDQQLLADASKEVADEGDWGRVASELRTRAAFRASRPWMKRVPQ